MKRHKTVEEYIRALESWQEEIVRLREILQSLDLEETVKWGMPVYTHSNKNVVGLSAFKNHFGLWFYQGALLPDPEQILVNAQDGKTKAMRQWRMTSKKDIKVRLIKNYVKAAIQAVQDGKEIKPDRQKPVVLPDVLKKALAKDKRAKACFDKMSRGCRREYADYISEAKREETKLRRLQKILPMIRESAGLNDKYR